MCEVIVLATLNLDALVTAREAQDHPGLRSLGVCRHTIASWRANERLAVVDQLGRSPRYRLRDLLLVERDTRRSGSSHRRRTCRSCLRVAERS